MRTTTIIIALLLTCTAALAEPSVAFRKLTLSEGNELTALHRGLNFVIIGRDLQWDPSVPADNDFYDVALDPTFQAQMNALRIGSVRIPGGALANYHDYWNTEGWVSWALGSSGAHNADVWWPDWWSFYRAIGSPAIVSTTNVFTDGNPATEPYVDPFTNQQWAAVYDIFEGITGAIWEPGNETYISATVPGMSFLTYGAYDVTSYPYRACEAEGFIHGYDPSAEVGLVVYEHGTVTSYNQTTQLLSDVSVHCPTSGFDFYIVHDYAPLMPYSLGAGAFEFRDSGVRKALAYIDIVDTVGALDAAPVPSKPVYVTEYGLLFNNPDNWLSRWYEKATALLAAHHWLELASEGADGLWFWEAISKWFRVVDADAAPPATNAWYALLQRLHELNGRVVRGGVTGAVTWSVSGDIGTGCWDNDSTKCWYIAHPSSAGAVSVPSVRSYAIYDATAHTVTVALFNFAAIGQSVDVSLDGFLIPGVPHTIERWAMQSSGDWNASLSAPAVVTITKTPAVTKGRATFSSLLVPRRGLVLLEIPVP